MTGGAWATCSVVAATDAREGVCPGCSRACAVAEMHGLTAEGTVRLFLMVSCGSCGESNRCALCPAVVAADGAVTYQHIATAHGGSA